MVRTHPTLALMVCPYPTPPLMVCPYSTSPLMVRTHPTLAPMVRPCPTPPPMVRRLVWLIFSFHLVSLLFSLSSPFRIIKMSSPKLNNLIILGCILCYASIFLFGMDARFLSLRQYGVICNVRKCYHMLSVYTSHHSLHITGIN